MGFDQGLSGLNATSKEIDVIGNNIANANTAGFKASSINFASVYASALGGGGASAVGIGVSAAKVVQKFTQGTVTNSTNPLDMAINGNGFFQLSTNGAVSYTRNGQFQLNGLGEIVTANGANLQGYNANANGVLNIGSTGNITISSANIPPQPTSSVLMTLNLDANASVLTSANFNSANPNTYSYSNSVGIYDSMGNSHALQTYYVNTGITAPSTEAQWDVYATLDGAPIGYTPPATPVPIGTFAFTSAGALDPATTTPALTMPIALTFANGAIPQTVNVGYLGTTQYGASSAVNSQSQDGYSSGQLTQFSAGSDGIITGTYSNGKTQTLGQIVLTNFVNPSGLTSGGSNVWYATSESGAAILGTPGSGSFGTLQSGSIESSTTDLTEQLVKMITAQQNYQANAQTIKTQSQIQQTLVNL
jgi:flagellar hook protein FlgE